METIEFTNTETSLVTLPDEVKELALRVPEAKQKEVQTVLSQIFAGTSDWKKQADSIVVKDINDKMSIQLADTGRKNVKTARLAAEKIFDAKRDEVQQKKSEFDLEDKLWLKAKQTAQILFKDIESTFEWKAKFAERYEAEQKELITQLRIEKVSKFTDDINRIALENMSDQIFDMFLSGIEKAHNDKIAAEKKVEDERLASIEAERIKQEKIRKENIRLKKEAEEKERLAEIERKEKERLEKEIADKKAADEKLKRDAELKLQAEQKAKTLAEKKAKLAPDKIKLLNFGQALNDVPRPEIKSIKAAEIMANINGQLVRLNNYIIESANKL